MQEKTIIKSEGYNIKKVLIIIAAIAFCVAALLIVIGLTGEAESYRRAKRESWYHPWFENQFSSAGEYVANRFIYYFLSYMGFVFLPVAAICLLVHLGTSKISIEVTDKRITGKAFWGRNVDLPLDSVSSIGRSWLKGIEIGTSSGKISFSFIKNAEEIRMAVNNLLIQRQTAAKEVKPVESTTIIQTTDEADKIRKFKSLLDEGLITQEEFEAKKKQLLDL